MTDVVRRLLTGRNSHEIYVVEDGKKRWIPDLWTMREVDLSPSGLQVVEDDELASYEEQKPISSTVPHPSLEEGTYVESERIIYVMIGRKLRPIRDPRQLMPQEDFDPNKVIYLPASLIRGLVEEVN